MPGPDELIAHPEWSVRLRDVIQPGQTLLMGANRAEPAGERRYRYYNTLIAFRRDEAALRVKKLVKKARGRRK